jgi:hypothetical protein
MVPHAVEIGTAQVLVDALHSGAAIVPLVEGWTV